MGHLWDIAYTTRDDTMLRLLTLLSAIFLASAATASTFWVDAPRDGYLNLRTGPSVQYKVLGKMPHGSQVKLLDAPGKWVKVRHVSGLIGWTHSGYLTDSNPAKARDRDTGYSRGQTYWIDAPRDGHLNLRSGPGTRYKVIDKMPHGATARVVYKQNGWYKLTFDGRTGWASSRFLSDQKPAAHRDRDQGQVYWIDAPRNGQLNLRSGPGRNYKVIDKMPHGAKARVIYKQNGWYKLRFDGKTGWANSRRLSDHKVKDTNRPGKQDTKTYDNFVDAFAACSGLNRNDRQACIARNIRRIK